MANLEHSYSAAAFIASLIAPVIAQAVPYSTVYSFKDAPDGGAPIATMTVGGAVLYGTTEYGGNPDGYGTVFQFDPVKQKETVIYQFQGGSDGSHPYSGVLYDQGYLYGTTFDGGASQDGTVFKIDLTTGKFKTLYSFTGSTDGANPRAIVIVGGSIYGVASFGGSAGAGVVFKVNPKTGHESTLVSFPGFPAPGGPSSLIYKGGSFYGTTSQGGTGSSGTLFSVSRATGSLTVLHSFGNGTDGALPEGIVVSGTTIYGATHDGGANNVGSLFSYDLTTSTEKVIYSFIGPEDGCQPVAAPTVKGGVLFGTTTYCGISNDYGSIYKLDIKTGVQTTLHLFSGSPDTYQPQAGLVFLGRAFYGCGRFGGAGNAGTLFKVKP